MAFCNSSHSDRSTKSERSEYEDEPKVRIKKSKLAANLLTTTNVSISKAVKICKQLSIDGVEILAPSQAAIPKLTFKEVTELEKI